MELSQDHPVGASAFGINSGVLAYNNRYIIARFKISLTVNSSGYIIISMKPPVMT